jgi:AraC-like DNA-binding protein
MALEDVSDSWRLLAGLQCRSAVHMGRIGRFWGAWGVHCHSVPSVVIPLLGCSLLDIDDHHILPLTPGEVVLLWRDEGTWYGDLPWSLVDRHVQAIASAGNDTGRRHAAERLLRTLADSTPARRSLSAPLQAMCSFAWRMRTQRITAAQILAASGLSYSVAHDLFVSRFAETPKQYLLRCRLDLAEHLMLAGGQPGTVWREAGFADRADLTRRFRLVHGVAPLAWLRHNRMETKRPAPARGAGLDD